MEEELIKGCAFLKVDRHVDQRGELSVLTDNLPNGFQPYRIYYVKGLNEGQMRGSHAHRHISQVLFVLKGKISVTVDDGKSSAEAEIGEESEGLYMPPMIWCSIMAWESGSIYMVLADGPYDKLEYISSFDEFKRLRQGFT